MHISGHQMSLLRAGVLATFTQGLVEHVRAFCPATANRLGATPLFDAVASLVQQAQAHGFTKRGPTRLWVELGFMFGSGFWCDPMLPWISREVAANDESRQMDTAGRLYAQALKYRQRVGGPANAFYLDSLRRAESVSAMDPSRGVQTLDQVVGVLDNIYPQRARFAGPEATAALVLDSAEFVRSRGSCDPVDILVVALSMSYFGHHFHCDPQFPWLSRIFSRQQNAGQTTEIAHLRKIAVAYLQSVLGSAH